MGGAVFPPCYLTWGQTMVEVMEIMVTSFKMSHAHTATLSAPSSATGHRQPTPPPETPGHSRASLDQPLVGSLLLSPGSWCTQGFICATKSVSPVLYKFLWLYGSWWWPPPRGLMLHPALLHPEPCPAAVHHSPAPPLEMLRHSPVSVSVGSLGPGVHKVCLNPLRISSGYRVWFWLWFRPSYHLAGTSPLPLDMGYLFKVAPALHSRHSSPYHLAGASLSLDMAEGKFSSLTLLHEDKTRSVKLQLRAEPRNLQTHSPKLLTLHHLPCTLQSPEVTLFGSPARENES